MTASAPVTRLYVLGVVLANLIVPVVCADIISDLPEEEEE
jgi:hypothetical protein